MAGKRTFASIQRIASGRWQVRYTDPSGRRRYAPHTFETRINADAWVVAARRKIDRDQWTATDADPVERVTFGAYAARWLANRQVAGPTHQGAHPGALQRDSGPDPAARVRQSAARPRSSPRTFARGMRARSSTGRRCASHAYSLLRTILASAVNEELIDAQPGQDRRRRPRDNVFTRSGRRRSPSSASSPRQCPSGCS